MPDRPEPRLAHGPHPAHHQRLAAGDDARVLDPSQAPVVPGVSASPTAYLASRLMVAKGAKFDDQVALLQLVAQDVGWKVQVNREPAKARAKLGWEPKHRWEEAIKTTIQWFKDHQPWWRAIKSGEYLKYYEQQYVKR